MATEGAARRLNELVFLHRGPILLRAFVVCVVAVASAVAGVALFRLHESYAARLASGSALDALQSFIARGSSPATLWPGWLAAVCFAVALLRVRREPLEPSPGLHKPEGRTIAQLRHGLRWEYAAVRAVLVVVSVVAAVDTARALAFAAGAERAGASPLTPWPVYAEAAGLIAATLMLAWYAWVFGGDVSRIGAA